MVLVLWWVYRTQSTHEKSHFSIISQYSFSCALSFYLFIYFLLLKEQNPRTDVENVEIDGKRVRQPAVTDI